jgi:hypothetical protein
MLGDYLPVSIKAEQVTDPTSGQVLGKEQANKILAFVRFQGQQRLLVVSHFEQHQTVNLDLLLDQATLRQLGLTSGEINGTDLLTGNTHKLQVNQQSGYLALSLNPMQSVVIQL